MKSTLIFNQNAMKMVRLHDDCIEVQYGDGAEPVFIHDDDEMYSYHLNNFKMLITNALAEDNNKELQDGNEDDEESTEKSYEI